MLRRVGANIRFVAVFYYMKIINTIRLTYSISAAEMVFKEYTNNPMNMTSKGNKKKQKFTCDFFPDDVEKFRRNNSDFETVGIKSVFPFFNKRVLN